MPAEREHPDAERLIADGRALRALARSLVGRDDAEDVVHDGFVAALAQPGAPRQLGAWLAGTVRRLALLRRRAALRRAAREAAVARDASDAAGDPALLAQQSELIRDVAAAVHGLEEPFRSVVLLRFWRGLGVDAIAQRLDVPRNTVRSRLQRGLDRLRARLDTRHGERARWSAPLAALAHLDGAAAPAAAVGAAWSMLLAGATMKTKLLAAAVALVAVALAVPFLLHERGAGDAVPGPAQPMPAVAAAAAAPSAAGPTEREPVAVAGATAAAEPAATPPFDTSPVEVEPWLVQLAVVDEDHRPVADAAVAVWAALRADLPQHLAALRPGNQYSGHAEQPLLRLRSDAQGGCSAMVAVECVVVAAARAPAGRSSEHYLRSDDRAGRETVTLVLEPRIVAHGRVVRADGSPGAGARVSFRLGGAGNVRGAPRLPAPVTADANGAFAFDVQRQIVYRVTAELDGQRSFDATLSVLDREPPNVVLTMPGGISIAGIVVDADGRPVPQASIGAWTRGGDNPWTRSDAHGRFTFLLPAHAPYQLVAGAAGHANGEPTWCEPTPARPHVETRLVLQRLQRITGRVVREDGSPFAGVRVAAGAARGSDEHVDGEPSRTERYGTGDGTTTGADGGFALAVHPAVPANVTVRPSRDNPRLCVRVRDVAPGTEHLEIVVRDADLAGCVVHGTAVGAADGRPVNGLEVQLVHACDFGIVRLQPLEVTQDGTRFTCAALPLGERYGIQFGQRRGEGATLAPVRFEPFETTPQGLELHVRLPAWAELPVRVLAADGSPARAVRVWLAATGLEGGWMPAEVDGEGRAVLSRRSPGPRELVVLRDGEELLRERIELAPGPNAELVLRLPATRGGGERR